MLNFNVNFNLKIRSGPCQAIASATVIAYDGNPIRVELPEQAAIPSTPASVIIFKFEDDKTTEQPQPRLDARIIDGQTLELTFKNFNNPLGTGNTKPTLVGKMRGRPAYLQYRVYDLAGADKTLHFTV